MLQGNVLLNVRMSHYSVLGEALFQAQAIMQNRPICRIYAMTLLRAIFCQTFALAITFIVTFWLPIFHHPIAFLLAQCGLAVSGSLLLRQPIWWIPIHLLFLPSVFIFFTISLPAWLYLVIVIALTLIFWGTIRGDVPLFLSSKEVTQAVSVLLEQECACHFADLGAGVGSVAIPVAKRWKNITVDAWELAPIPWLISAWRGRNVSNYTALRQNFFTADFEKYDVIFAFLSPVVVPEISEKIRREMRSGTLFISSSFPVPNWTPESIQHIDDFRKTVLFCYRIA